MHYDPENRTLERNPFKALAGPRPIGWVTSMSRAGAVNLAPYSFFNAIGEAPDLVAFSSNGMKDAAAFAEEGGEFVCSFATYDLREAMNRTSAPLPRGESEFDFAGLTPAPSSRVRPPRVAESPAAIECRWVRTVPLEPLDGAPVNNYLVIGQVVSYYIDDRFVVNGRVDTAAMHPILRGGYFDYFHVGPENRFEMRRPPGGGDVPA
jgi:flavin reductase (DIM6/NTAB) family NADH-FMN oxidoreductase RutF